MLTPQVQTDPPLSLSVSVLREILEHAKPLGHHEEPDNLNLGFGFVYYGLVRALRPAAHPRHRVRIRLQRRLPRAGTEGQRPRHADLRRSVVFGVPRRPVAHGRRDRATGTIRRRSARTSGASASSASSRTTSSPARSCSTTTTRASCRRSTWRSSTAATPTATCATTSSTCCGTRAATATCCCTTPTSTCASWSATRASGAG